MLLAEKWLDKVIEVVRECDKIINMKHIIGKLTITFISAYAPQSEMTDEQKDQFCEILLQTIAITNE